MSESKGLSDIPLTTLMRDWLSNTFPKFNLYLHQEIYGIYTVDKTNKISIAPEGIVAIVLRDPEPWISGAWARTGIWTRLYHNSRWETCRPVTLESPDFFYVLEETIGEEYNRWK